MADAGESALMFDAVFVRREAGLTELSVAEFLGLPLTERVRSLIEHKVEFRRNGATVSPADAMKSLMRQAASR
jgi:hypothetical protein